MLFKSITNAMIRFKYSTYGLTLICHNMPLSAERRNIFDKFITLVQLNQVIKQSVVYLTSYLYNAMV